MRCVVVLLVALCAAMTAHAGSRVRIVAKHVPMDIYEIVHYDLQCPPGYVPVAYSVSPQYSYDDDEEQSRDLVDRNGAVLTRDAIANEAQIDGAGMVLQVFNTEHHAKNL